MDEEKDEDVLQDFYFLEMNTRLQVEHPVTEAVSDVDLVEAMLQVGADRGLPRDWYSKAKEIVLLEKGKLLIMPYEGHAIEGRIYAEDPTNEYLPSTGTLLPYREPWNAVTVNDDNDNHHHVGAIHNSGTADGTNIAKSSYLRLDSGVVEGNVGTYWSTYNTNLFRKRTRKNHLTHLVFFFFFFFLYLPTLIVYYTFVEHVNTKTIYIYYLLYIDFCLFLFPFFFINSIIYTQTKQSHRITIP